MAAKKIKRFEAFMHGQWYAWIVGEQDVVSIEKSSGGMFMVIKRNHPDAGPLATYVNIEQVEAYTVG